MNMPQDFRNKLYDGRVCRYGVYTYFSEDGMNLDMEIVSAWARRLHSAFLVLLLQNQAGILVGHPPAPMKSTLL